eukprot:scaffold1146_cov399-Prasinococcus_capsulatus_cf.AAC.41
MLSLWYILRVVAVACLACTASTQVTKSVHNDPPFISKLHPAQANHLTAGIPHLDSLGISGEIVVFLSLFGTMKTRQLPIKLSYLAMILTVPAPYVRTCCGGTSGGRQSGVGADAPMKRCLRQHWDAVAGKGGHMETYGACPWSAVLQRNGPLKLPYLRTFLGALKRRGGPTMDWLAMQSMHQNVMASLLQPRARRRAVGAASNATGAVARMPPRRLLAQAAPARPARSSNSTTPGTRAPGRPLRRRRLPASAGDDMVRMQSPFANCMLEPLSNGLVYL